MPLGKFKKIEKIGIEWETPASCLCRRVNMLGESLQTIRENTEIFIKASKGIGSEVNSEKTKHMITSRQQNIVQNQNTVIENLSFEKVEKFRYLGVTVTNRTTSAKKLNAE